MNQKISPPSQKLDGLFLLALSMAVFFVGVTEFMLSSMLAAGAGVPHHYQRRRLADLQLRVLLCDRRAVAGLLLRPHATQEAAAARPGPLRGRYSGHRHRPDPGNCRRPAGDRGHRLGNHHPDHLRPGRGGGRPAKTGRCHGPGDARHDPRHCRRPGTGRPPLGLLRLGGAAS